MNAQAENNHDRPLPALREELQMLPGSPLLGGAPSWMIYDPVREKFFQVGIEVFELLSIWPCGTVGAIIEKAASKFGRNVDEGEVDDAIQFLAANSLTRESPTNDFRDFVEQKRRTKQSLLGGLIHNYLFFRVPLVRPADFLRRSLPYVEFLFSRVVAMLAVLVTVLGLYLVSRQWEAFIGQFSHLFSVAGIATYIGAIVVVKILHELGHAYTATRYGARVSTMGIAFLVMMPVAYTDTTDAWRLRSFRQRAMIDAAGMIVELAIAGFATFVWAFLQDGPVRSAVFALATTSWVMSLVVNLNPMMRFDGYYLLADTLGIPNLQPRSFALAKWRLREFLFGLNEPAPEPAHRYRSFMIYYGYAVWVYRFLLFLGIALLVYAFFFKALGVALFIVEIIWFIAMPIYKELEVWWQKKGSIQTTRRSKLTVACLAILIAAFVVPWSGAVHVPAVLSAGEITTVYSKHAGRIRSIAMYPGMTVQAGDVLLELESPQLEYELEAVDKELALLQLRHSRRAADRIDRDESIVLSRQLDTARAKRSALLDSLDELRIRASFSGVVTDIDEDLHIGLWINEQIELGTLVNPETLAIRGYVGEQALPRIAAGQAGVFVADDATQPAVDVQLADVARADNEVLDIPYLASVYGGDISAHHDADELLPLESAFLVQFSAPETAVSAAQAMRGTIRLAGKKESYAVRAWRTIARVSVREMGI